ncbi:hypothetical protein MVEN_01277900 [Mycena venus]|uniref:F-box domain-containing protein n=1 Tax=Mycena venus TaxID=2733690 RepID=A0A8H6Y636_9AGAR|nr:hypothetical protein MVEN_01277900 [Mycena venus]
MHLIDLGTDVLSHTFAFTDVYTILSLSRVDKYFHDISSTKQLWISIARDLFARRLIDTPVDEIDTLSKDALVEEVRRVVAGPRTWSSSSLLPPTVLRQESIRLECFRSELLPGGTHILLWHDDGDPAMTRITCFDVQTGRRACIWSQQNLRVYAVTVDCSWGTSEMVVALAVATPDFQPHQLLFTGINMDTGQSRDLFCLPLSEVSLSESQLRGDFFISFGNFMERFILLINWRTETFVILEPNIAGQRALAFAILPGHIVLVHSVSGSTAPSVHISSLAVFDNLWRPLTEFNFNGAIYPTELTSVALLEIPNHGRAQFTMLPMNSCSNVRSCSSAPLPPLVSLLLRLKLGARPRQTNIFTNQQTIIRCHVTFPARQLPQLTSKSAFRHWKQFISVSGAGYDGTMRTPPRDLNLDAPVGIHLTQSGAVVVTDGSEITVMYYQ